MSCNAQDPIPVGSVWREIERNRLIRITRDADPPAWVYIDAKGNPEPHGYEPANGFTYNDWFEHRCDAYDFVVWGRFERVS